MEFTTLILQNSPIEFVLVGPHQSRDAVILKSENSGLDLLGMASEGDIDSEKSPTFNLLASMFLPNVGRQLNVVESYQVTDLESSKDKRRSSFRFAWVGYCNPSRKRRIKQSLDRSIIDIRQGVLDKNIPDIELSISSLIYNCSLAHQQQLRQNRVYFGVFLIYAVFIVYMIYTFARNSVLF